MAVIEETPFWELDWKKGVDCLYDGNCPDFCYAEDYGDNIQTTCVSVPFGVSDLVDTAMGLSFRVVFLFAFTLYYTVIRYRYHREKNEYPRM